MLRRGHKYATKKEAKAAHGTLYARVALVGRWSRSRLPIHTTFHYLRVTIAVNGVIAWVITHYWHRADVNRHGTMRSPPAI